MNIIITTPKNEIETSNQERQEVESDKDGYYFRVFKTNPNVDVGDKIYEVEDGFIVGYGIVFEVIRDKNGLNQVCDTTGRQWDGKCIVKYKDFVDIEPIPMKGFQGFRYADKIEELNKQSMKKISYKLYNKQTDELLIEADSLTSFGILKNYGTDIVSQLTKSGTRLVISDKNIMKQSAISEEDGTQVASIAVMTNGEILMGKRNDNGKWTLPGGHSKQGENPIENAIRELKEETGITAEEEELIYLGQDTVDAEDTQLIINCFLFNQKEKTNSSHDPDEECDTWEYIDVSDGLPEDILSNLHSNPNITLTLLGLQETNKEDMTKKSGISEFFRGQINDGTVTKFKNMFLRLNPKQQKEAIQNLEGLLNSGQIKQQHFGKEMLDIANMIYNLNNNKSRHMSKLDRIKQIKAEVEAVVDNTTTCDTDEPNFYTEKELREVSRNHKDNINKESGDIVTHNQPTPNQSLAKKVVANPIDGLEFDEGDIDKDYSDEISKANSVINEQESKRIVSDMNYLRRAINEAIEGKWKNGSIFISMREVSSKFFKSLIKGNTTMSIEQAKDFNKQLRDKYYELNPDKKTTTTGKLARIKQIKAEVQRLADFGNDIGVEDTVTNDSEYGTENPIFQVGETVTHQGRPANIYDFEDGEYTLTYEDDFSQGTATEQELMAENQGK